MPPLFPPDYPYRPDAPLLSLGPAFSEEIARSVVGAIWHENRDQPHETNVRTAAGLTMLEAFHPRDQLETMFAAQGVAAHCAITDDFRCAADPNMPPQLALKFRANAASMSRMFCMNLRELTHLQSRPLPPRPGQPLPSPTPTGDPPEAAPAARPRARAKTPPANVANPPADSGNSLPDPLARRRSHLCASRISPKSRKISRPVRTARLATSRPTCRSLPRPCHTSRRARP